MQRQRDYVLGDAMSEEVAGLACNDRVCFWRASALECWPTVPAHSCGTKAAFRRRSVSRSSAAIDLAEIVAAHGDLLALDRSQNFICAMGTSVARRFAHEREGS